MGVFSQKSKFKAAAPTIRKEVVAVDTPKSKPKPKPRPLAPPSSSGLRVPSSAAASAGSPRLSPASRKSASPYPTSSDESRLDRKRKRGGATHRPSPASDRVEFDKDSESEDDDWEAAVDARKRRARLSSRRRRDETRKLAHPALARASRESPGKVEELSLIHSADVASLALRCVPVLGATADEVAVELQYPGSLQRER